MIAEYGLLPMLPLWIGLVVLVLAGLGLAWLIERRRDDG